MSVETQLFDPTRLSLQGTLAQDVEHSNTGTLLSAMLGHSLNERLGVSVNGSQQTAKYRELSDALQRRSLNNPNSQSRSRYQWGAVFTGRKMYLAVFPVMGA